ncbi:MAG: 4Fe-4S dicluster domain-containing protein [Methanotrichaceae archaeon]|nr:4Fe-4S dicluster domain-containing protein [Methanotrichaceae archaeon]
MKEIFVRLDRCLGCRSCEMACAVEHSTAKSMLTAASEVPAPRRRLYVEYALGQKIPLVCRHCEDAPCVAVCRTGAMRQDPITGIVDRDQDRCVGCYMCAMVCPYGVIGQQRESRMVVKCDRCGSREIPACVEACPVNTLIFAEEADFAEILRKDAASRIARGYSMRA